MAEGTEYLDFERPLIAIEEELERLRARVENGEVGLVSEVEKLENRLTKLRSEVYRNLNAYQRVRLSRHFERPFTLDYIRGIMSGFVELHGDRVFGDDAAVVGGIAKLDSRPVVVVGHQRGRTTQERIQRNFGMPQPEGNRKARRLYELAGKFRLPLITFVDTQGAYPGLEAEERGQAESIARNLYVLAGLETPIISVVIGEGGSGGALALAVCDRLLMLENAIYSVITPEGCASILWGKTEGDSVGHYAEVAAEALKLTAHALADMGIVDEVIREPLGGAHRDSHQAVELVGQAVAKHLSELVQIPPGELVERRYQKFRRIGAP